MIKLRMDVDYPYPSRIQSILFTLLDKKTSKNYLTNSKIIARMVNESPREVMAYWFFTPQTIPDEKMIKLMHPDRHEVALHVANHPYSELEKLQNVTKRKLNYYTIHGTERLFSRLMWRRKIWQARVPIPKGFLLKNFWDFPTMALDRTCYSTPTAQAVKIAEKSIEKGEVLHIHPEWLFQHGTLNHRGPYYETLKTILKVDEELEGLAVSRKSIFLEIAQYAGTKEYEQDILPSEQFLEKLSERGVDLFTFIERKWSNSIPNIPTNWVKQEDNIALLHVTTYDDWWSNIGKKTRNMVRKAEKNGISTTIVEPSEKLAEGIWKIYNETPIRQERAFPHYGTLLDNLTPGILASKNCSFVGAFFQEELVGFIQLVYGQDIAIISQILSLQEHWDKAVNNILVAKAVEVCAAKHIPWIMYGRIGNHPSLDNFKQNNSFTKFTFTRYYIPLTRKGRIAIKLRLHRRLKDSLPSWIKEPMFPVFNWISRTKVKIQLKLH